MWMAAPTVVLMLGAESQSPPASCLLDEVQLSILTTVTQLRQELKPMVGGPH